MEMGLFLQQSTSLVMTQELKQAIQLLQFSSAEIRDFLKEQALENPLIELNDKVISHPLFHQHEKITSDAKHRALENQPANKSLQDILVEQLSEMQINDRNREHLQYVIDSIDENGYLMISIEEFCTEQDLTVQLAESCIQMIQDMEPAGVGARDLGECLLLQLKRSTEKSELAEQIVANHMEQLAAKKWKELSAHYQVEVSDIQKVNDLILQLDPYPGRSYSKDLSHFVAADVAIMMNDDGEPVVTVIDSLLGSIKVNQEYKTQLMNSGGECADYAKAKTQEAQWLIQSLTQRQQTIRRAAEVIAVHQQSFLATKQGELNSLTLKEVALVMGVHESTVSRATSNKYAQTPRGLIELKSMFSSGYQSISKQTLKAWLKEFIQNEDKHHPLSDQELVSLYKQKDVDLSRRVIAKYRGELGIESSAKRKRY